MQDASNAAPHSPDGGDADENTGPQIGDPASIHVIVGTSRARVVLSGEIDAEVSSELGDAISDAEASGLPVEIDAHHVTFMDSSGVAFLARLASRSPHTVRILRAPPTVRFLLEVTRIGELLEIVDDDPGVDLDITSAQH
ncbi:STAS domain-containing protein [Isoptericola haloaureus]|uniref:STAS domain-containing protein n=1 Tax=Isoptericola haloaureus TaxID=1542902 RepID=A0ABU7Z9R1_9MICO